MHTLRATAVQKTKKLFILANRPTRRDSIVEFISPASSSHSSLCTCCRFYSTTARVLVICMLRFIDPRLRGGGAFVWRCGLIFPPPALLMHSRKIAASSCKSRFVKLTRSIHYISINTHSHPHVSMSVSSSISLAYLYFCEYKSPIIIF